MGEDSDFRQCKRDFAAGAADATACSEASFVGVETATTTSLATSPAVVNRLHRLPTKSPPKTLCFGPSGREKSRASDASKPMEIRPRSPSSCPAAAKSTVSFSSRITRGTTSTFHGYEGTRKRSKQVPRAGGDLPRVQGARLPSFSHSANILV